MTKSGSSGRRSAQPLGSAKNDIKNIDIFDVLGRKQKAEGRRQKAENGGGSLVVDISHLSSGIYFVRIITEDGVVTKKVVKQ